MSNSFSTPLRVGAVVLGVVALVAIGLVVAYGPGEGRWIQGALGASPAKSGSPSPTPSASPTTTEAGEPAPSATPSPSPSTAAQIKAKNIADAKARLVEYYATTAEVANNGYKDWEKELLPFWGRPQIWRPLSDVFAGYATEGRYTEGEAVVGSMRATGYKAAEQGFEEVSISACIDFSNVATFESDGTRIPRDAAAPLRYKFDYLMAHSGDKGVFKVYDQEPKVGESC